MSKSSTNLSLDPELKKASIELFNDLGLDLSSAVTLFFETGTSCSRITF